MVEFTVTIKGLERVIEQLDAIGENAEDVITEGLTRVAARLVEVAQESLSEAYPPPSLPGSPPHARTGTLLRSVRIESVEPLKVTVAAGGEGSGAPYAAYLEFGTSQIEPRPFMIPAALEILPDATQEILDTVNRHLEKHL